MEHITVNLSGKIRRATLQGKEYYVAPATMIVPGVLHGSNGPIYYPIETISESPDDWNHMPIVVYHPQNNGQYISARTVDILETQGVGIVLNSTANGKLQAEAWFDIEQTRKVDNRIIEALESGKKFELSTGLSVGLEDSPGVYNNREYTSIARSIKPDHLAVFVDQIGACSIADGCGVLANHRPDQLPIALKLENMSDKNCTCQEKQVSNVVGEVSFGDISEQLHKAFKELAPPVYDNYGHCINNPYISGIYRDFFIFHSDLPEEDATYKQGYSVSDGGVVSISDKQPQRVEKSVKFVSANQGVTTMALKPEEKEAIIKDLTANCECWKGPNDATLLNSMPDDKLTELQKDMKNKHHAFTVANAAIKGFSDSDGNVFKLNPANGKWEQKAAEKTQQVQTGNAGNPFAAVTQPATQNTQTQQPVPRTMSADEWWKTAPDGVRETYNESREIVNREKERLIDRLVSHLPEGEREMHRQRLVNRSVKDLESDLAMLPKASPKRETTSVNSNREEEQFEDDMLTPMTMNWEKDTNGRSVPRAQVVATETTTRNTQNFSIQDDAQIEDIINSLPAQFRNRFSDIFQLEADEKSRLIRQLTENCRNEDQEQQMTALLSRMTVNQLRTMAGTFGGSSNNHERSSGDNYFGAAAPAGTGSRIMNEGGPDDETDMLVPMTFNWDEIRKQA